MKKRRTRKYIFEFLSIFIAVISAFALNNWNDNRRDREAADKILTEIANGLQKDLEDIAVNSGGHENGIDACIFWRKIILNQEVSHDSLRNYYFGLTRDFFSAQNNSGYETLKSKGLELIRNDSLRYKIISLYEYDFTSLKTMEENYAEMQFHTSYFKEINAFIAPHLTFDDRGNITGIETPLDLTEAERKTFLTYLWRIRLNRMFILQYYETINEKIENLIEEIEEEKGR